VLETVLFDGNLVALVRTRIHGCDRACADFVVHLDLALMNTRCCSLNVRLCLRNGAHAHSDKRFAVLRPTLETLYPRIVAYIVWRIFGSGEEKAFLNQLRTCPYVNSK